MDKDKLVKCNELLEKIDHIKNGRGDLEWYIGENFLESFEHKERRHCFKKDIDLKVMIEDLRQTLRKYYDNEELDKLEKEFSGL